MSVSPLAESAQRTSCTTRESFEATRTRFPSSRQYVEVWVRYRWCRRYWAPLLQSVVAQAELTVQHDEERRRRKAHAQKRQLALSRRTTSPEPLPGRSHAGLQTETFLEVLSDRVPEEEVGTQTDPTKDRPPTPLFVPRPSGNDASTQIEPGDLFDFDTEVGPVLDVLVGKTLNHALIEVLQEDELAGMRKQQEAFAALRAAELAEVQRLESEVRRRQEERARRVQQERDRVRHQAEVQRKVAAAAFARSYLVSMRYSVLSQLAEQGHFYDPRRREIETEFMPQLFSAVSARATARGAERGAAALVDGIIAAALQSGGQRFADHAAQIEAGRLAVIAAEKAVEDAAAAKKAAEEAALAAAEAAAAAAAAGEVAAEGGGEEEGQ